MMKRYSLLAVSALNLWSLNIRAQESVRDESTAVIEDAKPETLAERIPSVTRRSFVKAGRLELTPTIGLSLNDPFYDQIPVGAGIHYHFAESLAVGMVGSYTIAVDNDPQVSGGIGEFDNEFDRSAYSGFLEFSWAPFYGKLSVLAESVLHFDTFVSLGAGVVGLNQGDPAVAGSVALGQHYFVSEWMAVRLEVRDQIFSMSRAIGPEVVEDNALQNLLIFTVGLALFPGDAEQESP